MRRAWLYFLPYIFTGLCPWLNSNDTNSNVSKVEKKDKLYIHERHELRIKLSTTLFRKERYEIIRVFSGN